MAVVRIHQDGVNELMEAMAYGLLNAAFYGETEAKRPGPDGVPVRGGNRSFAPQGPVGGTLRRSIHSVAYFDGQPLPGSRLMDENQRAIPQYNAELRGDRAVAFFGTNSDYGGFVNYGTVKMPARPFMEPAYSKVLANLVGLIAAGARRRLGQR